MDINMNLQGNWLVDIFPLDGSGKSTRNLGRKENAGEAEDIVAEPGRTSKGSAERSRVYKRRMLGIDTKEKRNMSVEPTPRMDITSATEVLNNRPDGQLEDEVGKLHGAEGKHPYKLHGGMDGAAFYYHCRFEEHQHQRHCEACKDKGDEWIKKHSFLHKGDGELVRYRNFERGDSPLKKYLSLGKGGGKHVYPTNLDDDNLAKSRGKGDVEKVPSLEMMDEDGGEHVRPSDSEMGESVTKATGEGNKELVTRSEFRHEDDEETVRHLDLVPKAEPAWPAIAPSEFKEDKQALSTTPTGAMKSLQENQKGQNSSESSSVWGPSQRNATVALPLQHLDWKLYKRKLSKTISGSMNGKDEYGRYNKKPTNLATGSLDGKDYHKTEHSDLRAVSLRRNHADSEFTRNTNMRMTLHPPYTFRAAPAGSKNFVGDAVVPVRSLYSICRQRSQSSIARGRSQEALNGFWSYRPPQSTVMPNVCSICASCGRVDNLLSPHSHVDQVTKHDPRHEEELQSVKKQFEQQEAGLVQSIGSLRQCMGDAKQDEALGRDALEDQQTKVFEVAAELGMDLKNERFADKEGRTADVTALQAQMQAALSERKRKNETMQQLRMELMRTKKQLLIAQQESATHESGLTQVEKGKECEKNEFSRDVAISREPQCVACQETAVMFEQGQPTQTVQVSFGDKTESECNNLRRDLFHTQQHLHLIHQQLEYLKGHTDWIQSPKSQNNSLHGSDSKRGLERTPEQLLSLEQGHLRQEPELDMDLVNMQDQDLEAEPEMKKIEDHLKTEIAFIKEKLLESEERCFLLEEQHYLTRVESVHSESEVQKELGSSQLQLYDGQKQFADLREEISLNSEKEKRYLEDLEKQLSESKAIKDKLLESEERYVLLEEQHYLTRVESVHSESEVQKELGSSQLQLYEGQKQFAHLREEISLNREKEKRYLEDLEKQLSETKAIKEKLLESEERCVLLEEQHYLTRVESVHSESEVQKKLGSSQLQLYEGHNQFAHLREEISMNCEKEKRYLEDLEKQLLETKAIKEKLLESEQRCVLLEEQHYLTRVESVHSESEVQKELVSYQLQLYEGQKQFADLREEISLNSEKEKRYLEDLEKQLSESKAIKEKLLESEERCVLLEEQHYLTRVESVHSESEVQKELGSYQLQLYEGQKEFADLREEISLNSEKEKRYLEDLEKQLSESKAIKEKLLESEERCVLLEEQHYLTRVESVHSESEVQKELGSYQLQWYEDQKQFARLKEEISLHTEKEKEYLEDLEKQLSESKELFSQFRKKSLADFQGIQEQLYISQQQAQEFTNSRRSTEEQLHMSQKHAEELSQLNTKLLQELEKTHQQLRVVQQTNEELSQLDLQHREILEKTHEQLRVVQQRNEELSQLDQQHREILTSKEAQLHLSKRHTEELTETGRKLSQELEETREKLNVVQQNSKELSQLNEQHRASLTSKEEQLRLSEQYAEELSEVRSRSLQELNEAREKLRVVQQKAEELSQLNKQHKESLTSKEDQLGISQRQAEELSHLRRKSIQELEDTRAQWHAVQQKAEELSKLNQQHAEDLSQERQKSLQELEETNGKLHLLQQKVEELSQLDKQHRESLISKEEQLRLSQRHADESAQLRRKSLQELDESHEQLGVVLQQVDELSRLDQQHRNNLTSKEEQLRMAQKIGEELGQKSLQQLDETHEQLRIVQQQREELSRLDQQHRESLSSKEEQLHKLQLHAEELSQQGRKSFAELDASHEQLRILQQKAENLSYLDQQHRKTLTLKEESELELKEKLLKTQAQLQEVHERLMKSEDESNLLLEQNKLLRVEGVHSEFEMHLDLGMSQVELREAQKRYEHLKEEMLANAEKETKCLKDLEDELLRTSRQKDEELADLDRHLRSSLREKEQSEVELQKELAETKVELEEVREILLGTQKNHMDLEDALRKELGRLHEAQNQYASLKEEVELSNTKENSYIKELLVSKKQAEELQDAKGRLFVLQQEQILAERIKREMESGAKKEGQHIRNLENQLSEAKDSLATFKEKALQDLQGTTQELQSARQQTLEISVSRMNLLQELHDTKEQVHEQIKRSTLLSKQLLQISNERHEFDAENQVLVTKLEQLQLEKIQLQTQIAQALEKFKELQDSNGLSQIPRFKREGQLLLTSTSDMKDVAFSMLDFVEDVAHMLGEMHDLFEENHEQHQRMRKEIAKYLKGTASEKETKDAASGTAGSKEGESVDQAESADCEKCAKDELEDALTDALRTYGIDPDGGGIPDDLYAKLKSERMLRKESFSTSGDLQGKHLHASDDADGRRNSVQYDGASSVVTVKRKSSVSGGDSRRS